MSLGLLTKDPADIRTYTIDWSVWLGSDTISTATWTLPSALTNVASTSTSTTSSIKLSGGSNGRVYNVACTVVTAAGQTKKVSFDLDVGTQ